MERLDDLKRCRQEAQARMEEKDTEEYRFAISMADILAKFPEKEKAKCKFEIHKLLYGVQQELFERERFEM